jgi:CIC family chloride channel protein
MTDRFFSFQPNIPGRGILASYRPTFWAMVVAIGIFSGLAGAALMELLHLAQHIAFGYSAGNYLSAVQRRPGTRRLIALAVAGVIAGAGALLLRRIRGFGGGEVSEAVWLEEGRMSFTLANARGVLSILIVGIGASIGREAAPQLAGASFASALCERVKVKPWQRKLLVACGAGAGMAAVYNIPLGGALFAVEVLLGTVALPLVIPAILCSLTATAVAWVALPTAPTYHIPVYPIHPEEIIWAALIGPLAGVAAGAWVKLVAAAHEARPPGKLSRAVAPMIVLAGLGALAIPYPQLLGNGKDTVQLAITAQLGITLLLALAILKPLVTAACLGAGAPGGLFTPTLTYGVLFGGLLGRLWSLAWPGSSAGAYALIGGAAVLAAAMQGPIAASVMVLELTRFSDTLMVPTLLAIAGATVVVRLLRLPSIYSARLGEDRRQSPPTQERPEPLAGAAAAQGLP